MNDVDTILAASEPPPLVVVSPDAGPRTRAIAVGGEVAARELTSASVTFPRAALLTGTRRSYESDLRMFCRWLAGYTEKEPIPETLVDEQLSFPRSAIEVSGGAVRP